MLFIDLRDLIMILELALKSVFSSLSSLSRIIFITSISLVTISLMLASFLASLPPFHVISSSLPHCIIPSSPLLPRIVQSSLLLSCVIPSVIALHHPYLSILNPRPLPYHLLTFPPSPQPLKP